MYSIMLTHKLRHFFFLKKFSSQCLYFIVFNLLNQWHVPAGLQKLAGQTLRTSALGNETFLVTLNEDRKTWGNMTHCLIFTCGRFVWVILVSWHCLCVLESSEHVFTVSSPFFFFNKAGATGVSRFC